MTDFFYTYETDADRAWQRRVVAVTRIVVPAIFVVAIALRIANIDWGFTWSLAGTAVFTPWLMVVLAVAPALLFAAELRAKHFVAVLLTSMLLFIGVPAAFQLWVA